jgi:bifunctional enzyme CysN/CysC
VTSIPFSSDRLTLVVAGHVDHGKSTLVGRLLADTGAVPEGKLERIRRDCERNGKPFEYAFLLDSLKDEQSQGITIDAARVFFSTSRREYQVIDAPGHVELIRNLVTGASRANAALLVIDAKEGVRENSRRHAALLSMLGIRQIAIAVNKMDLVGFGQEAFRRVESEIRQFVESFGLLIRGVVPVVSREGSNLTARSAQMPWYEGPDVLQLIESFEAVLPAVRGPLRMPVQGVYKFAKGGDDRRIIAGTVESGTLHALDEVTFHPSGKRAAVKTIEGFNQPARNEAAAGNAAGFTLQEQIYVTRGELAAAGPAPLVASRARTSIFWLGREPLSRGKSYVLKLGSARVEARVEAVHRAMDSAGSASFEQPESVLRNQFADCTLRFARPIAFDVPETCAATSRFVLVEDFEIRGGGIMREALADREIASSRAAVVWLTGLSGAGKTTIARALEESLKSKGIETDLLDGDEIRQAVPGAGFSRADRERHIQYVGLTASRLERHGVVVIVSLISPYAAARDAVRKLCARFIEVHVATPLEECERRDVKGLYARARRGELPQFTGISDPFEPPLKPELTIDTSGLTPGEAVERILRVLG